MHTPAGPLQIPTGHPWKSVNPVYDADGADNTKLCEPVTVGVKTQTWSSPVVYNVDPQTGVFEAVRLSPCPHVDPAPELYGNDATAITPVPIAVLQEPVADETSEILSTALAGLVPRLPSFTQVKTSR